MSEEVKIKDNIDSLLESIEQAEEDFKNHTIGQETMEDTVKELKMRVELVKMKEILKKIGNKKAPKSDIFDEKMKSLRETLKKEKPANEIPPPQ